MDLKGGNPHGNIWHLTLPNRSCGCPLQVGLSGMSSRTTMNAYRQLIAMALAVIGGLSCVAGDALAYTVYVSNEKGNSITVIDSDTLEVKYDPRRAAPARHHADQGRQVASRLRERRRHGRRSSMSPPTRSLATFPPARTRSSSTSIPRATRSTSPMRTTIWSR